MRIYLVLFLVLLPMSLAAVEHVHVTDAQVQLTFTEIPSEDTIYKFFGGFLISERYIEPTAQEDNVVTFTIPKPAGLIVDYGKIQEYVYIEGYDGICTGKDIYRKGSHDCKEVNTPNEIRITQVTYYEEEQTLAIQVRNPSARAKDMTQYSFVLNWNETRNGTGIVSPNAYQTNYFSNVAFDGECGETYFAGILHEGIVVSTTEIPIKCYVLVPECGDSVCSPQEQEEGELFCDLDCLEPIHLSVSEVTSQGIYYNYSNIGECIYLVKYADKVHQETLSSQHRQRHEQKTPTIVTMFGTYEEGDYTLRVACKTEEQTYKEEYVHYSCPGCMINGECVSEYTRTTQYFCSVEGEAERLREDDRACRKDGICQSNYCKKGICKTPTVWDTFFDRIKALFE